MSILRVDNFGPSAGGTTYSAGGIAKASGCFHHSSGTPTLSSFSINISSLIDEQTGDAGVNVASSFNSVGDYSVVASGWAYNTWTAASCHTGKPSAVRFEVTQRENGTLYDTTSGEGYPLMFTAHGDLA